MYQIRVISETEAARQQSIADDELLRLALRAAALERNAVWLWLAVAAAWMALAAMVVERLAG